MDNEPKNEEIENPTPEDVLCVIDEIRAENYVKGDSWELEIALMKIKMQMKILQLMGAAFRRD